MRAISNDQAAVYASASRTRAEHVKVEVLVGADWRDMSIYPGFDAVAEVSWAESIEEPHATADISLYRELDGFSLAPFMKASPPNVGFVPGGSWVPVLKPNREVRVWVALVPEGTRREDVSAGAWHRVFRGRIDRVRSASGDMVVLQCRDLGGRLATRWIKKEYVYAFAAVSGTAVRCRIFEKNASFALNEYVIPTQGKLNGHFYKVTTAGSTNASEEPTWPTGAGSTVTHGGVTFTEQGATGGARSFEQVLQNILDDNLGAGVVTLHVPTPTGVTVDQFVVGRGLLLETLRNLVLGTIGWDLRYKWDASAGTEKLTLYEPDRAASSPVRTFSSDEYEELEDFDQDIADVRNSWAIAFSDAADRWPDGTAKRKTIEVTDATSIADYEEQHAELGESDTSPIDSTAEATALVNKALSDTKEPTVTARFRFRHGFIHAELNDYYRFSPNNRHHSENLDLAVTEIRHEARGGHVVTSIGCRGKPTAGAGRWVELSGTKSPAGIHKLQVFESGAGITLSSKKVPGGQQVKVSMTPEVAALGEEFEWHLSTTSGFTPSSSSLVTVSRDRELTISDLVPGRTYYWRAVARIRNAERVARSEPTAEQSFVAGFAEPAHLNPETVLQVYPPNGSFEGWFEGASSPPDHHSMVTGVWGPDVERIESDRKDGLYALNFLTTAVAAKIRGAYFPVKPSVKQLLEGHLKKVGTPESGQNAQLIVEWYTAAKAAAATASNTITQALNALGSGWTRIADEFTAPSDAAYARVALSKGSAATFGFYADALRLIELPTVVAARAHTDAGQTLTDAAFVLIDFEEVDYDTHSAITTGAAWKFTVPAGQAGKYLVTVHLGVNLGTFAGYIHRDLFIEVNGSLNFPAANIFFEKSDCDDQCSARGSTILDLAAGDYISVKLYQDSGANRTLSTDDRYNHISIHRLP